MPKSTKKQGAGVQSRTATVTRNGESFSFENTDNLPADQFAIQCEAQIDEILSARKAYNKYTAVGKALLDQAASGTKASDFDDRLKDLETYEAAHPELAQGYVKKIAAALKKN